MKYYMPEVLNVSSRQKVRVFLSQLISDRRREREREYKLVTDSLTKWAQWYLYDFDSWLVSKFWSGYNNNNRTRDLLGLSDVIGWWTER